MIFAIMINNNSVTSLITFIRVPLMGYLFFIILYNSKTKSGPLSELLLLIKRLLIIQVFAAVLKYFIIGMSEKPVTTISATGGSGAVILPVMLSVILLAIFLFYKRDKRIFLLFPLILFLGFVNLKRGVWIFVPVILIVAFSSWLVLRYGWIKSLPFLAYRLPLIILAGSLIFYIGVRFNRSLNPDHKIWGKFDFAYALNFMNEYNDDEEYYKKTKLVKGRRAGLNYTLQLFFAEQPLITSLFGIGPDKLVAQQHQSEDVKSTGIESRGSMTGLVLYMWAAGIIPVLFFLLFFVQLLRFSIKCYKRYLDINLAFFPFVTLIFCVIFFMDFIFYTPAFINIPALQLLFYSFVAFSYHYLHFVSDEEKQKEVAFILLKET